MSDIISIVVPYYNPSTRIYECIESVLNQTYNNFELILVNDGSTNQISRDIYSKYKNNIKIKWESQFNKGVSSARNLGVESASGSYICFLDSDDTYDREFLEKMYIGVQNVDVCYTNYCLSYNGKNINKKPRLSSKLYDVSELESELIDDGTMSGILFGSVWQGIYDLNIIQENNIRFNQEIKINEDGIFNIEYLMYSNKLNYLSNDYLYYYHQSDESATKSLDDLSNIKTRAATLYLANSEKFKYIDKLDNQLELRKITEAFWQILKICNKDRDIKYFEAKIEMKKYIDSEPELLQFSKLNRKKMQLTKKVYSYLMQYRMYLSLYVLTKYIYPFLKDKVRR